jgi:uncharacterized membrane protein HdeD (DUF308 family)
MSFGGADFGLMRSNALARNWWAIVLRGVVALLFGLIAFINPAITLGSLVFVFGIYLLFDGAFAIVAAIRAGAHHRQWGILLLEGGLGLLAGAAALAVPGLAIVVWLTIMSIWAIASGLMMLIAAFQLHTSHGNWLLGVGGAVSMVWGGMLFFFPIQSAVVLTIWLGAYALIFGVSMIMLGFRLRSRHAAHLA